jgi:hypothetical protein
LAAHPVSTVHNNSVTGINKFIFVLLRSPGDPLPLFRYGF